MQPDDVFAFGAVPNLLQNPTPPGISRAAGGRGRKPYRPEIDGLRAIAVLAVMAFHAGLPFARGGYVGVDIFFVISGFLITTIIMEDLEAGRFSLVHFYTRRVRRIIPALAFVVTACCAAAWFVMLPHQIKDFSESVFAVATFSSNILFWMQTDYFAPAYLPPLIHTWSLGVEEQFYLAFPLFMLGLWKMRRREIALVFLVLLLTSLVAAAAMARADADGAFYLTPFRGWELLAGALAADLQMRHPERRWGNDLVAAFALLLIAPSIVLLRASSLVPGFIAIPVIAGTTLLLLFAQKGTIVGRCLAAPPLVWTGLISYSLYLWHVPLLAFAEIAKIEPLTTAERAALLVATFPIAYASWVFVEKPFRDRRRISARLAWAAAGAFTAGALAVGYAGYSTWGFYDIKLRSVSPEMRPYVIDRDREFDERAPFWIAQLEQSERPFPNAAPGGRLLVLGDSKSEDVYVAMHANPRLFPGLSVRRLRLDDPCMGELLPVQAGQMRLDSVPSNCTGDIRHLLASNLLAGSNIVVLAATWQEHSYSGAARLAMGLHQRGKRVIVVGSANFNDPASLSMRVAKGRLGPEAAQHYFWQNRDLKGARISDELRALVAGVPGIEFHSAYAFYCDDRLQRCRLFDPAGQPLMFDYGHLTVPGEEFVAQRLAELGWIGRWQGN